MRSYEEIVKECDAKIPRDCIESRDGGFGKKLSYLTGHYVIDRLNQVLGHGNWAFTSEVTKLHEGSVETRGGPSHSVHYMARVRLVATVGDKPTEFTDYGYGDGTDKTNAGKAHELAIKESITDGLKRAARCLGNSFGNGLYDKSGEGIDETSGTSTGTTAGVPAGKAVGGQGAQAPKVAPVASQERNSTQPVSVAAKGAGQAAAPREVVNKTIRATAKVLADKKVATMDQIKEILAGYGAKVTEDLNDTNAQDVLNKLQGMLG